MQKRQRAECTGPAASSPGLPPPAHGYLFKSYNQRHIVMKTGVVCDTVSHRFETINSLRVLVRRAQIWRALINGSLRSYCTARGVTAASHPDQTRALIVNQDVLL